MWRCWAVMEQLGSQRWWAGNMKWLWYLLQRENGCRLLSGEVSQIAERAGRLVILSGQRGSLQRRWRRWRRRKTCQLCPFVKVKTQPLPLTSFNPASRGHPLHGVKCSNWPVCRARVRLTSAWPWFVRFYSTAGGELKFVPFLTSKSFFLWGLTAAGSVIKERGLALKLGTVNVIKVIKTWDIPL